MWLVALERGGQGGHNGVEITWIGAVLREIRRFEKKVWGKRKIVRKNYVFGLYGYLLGLVGKWVAVCSGVGKRRSRRFEWWWFGFDWLGIEGDTSIWKMWQEKKKIVRKNYVFDLYGYLLGLVGEWVDVAGGVGKSWFWGSQWWWFEFNWSIIEGDTSIWKMCKKKEEISVKNSGFDLYGNLLGLVGEWVAVAGGVGKSWFWGSQWWWFERGCVIFERGTSIWKKCGWKF
jgi:hypothetical protein